MRETFARAMGEEATEPRDLLDGDRSQLEETPWEEPDPDSHEAEHAKREEQQALRRLAHPDEAEDVEEDEDE